MRASYSRRFSPVYLLPVLAAFIIALPAHGYAETKKATITVMKPGDLWLDDVQYTKVARGQRDGTWGYDVTYVLPGIGEKVLFWPRSKIDLDGSAPNKYRIQTMPRGKGRLLLPDTITTKSLPEVYSAILLLEGSYTKEARGNMVVAEAFATVTGLAAGLPGRAAAGVASRPAASSAATRAPVRPTAARPTQVKPTAAKPAAAKPAQAKPTSAKPNAAGDGGTLLWSSWKDYPKVTIAGREYAKIGERLYTQHAIERMLPSGLGAPAGALGAGRSIAPAFVEEAIATGTTRTQVVGGVTRTIHTSGSLQVVTEQAGRIVITVIPGAP